MIEVVPTPSGKERIEAKRGHACTPLLDAIRDAEDLAVIVPHGPVETSHRRKR